MRKFLLAAGMLAAAIGLSTPACAATIFELDAANSYIKVTSNQTVCVFGSCSLTADLLPLAAFSLSQGESYSFDFARLLVSPGFGGGAALIEAQLAFISPDAGPATNAAIGQYVRLGGIFRPGALIGSLDWVQDAQQIMATDGTIFTVSFADLYGVNFGGEVRAPVTIALTHVPAVPEQTSWILMIVGLGFAGAALRRARADADRLTASARTIAQHA